jgi:hypothetical protein
VRVNWTRFLKNASNFLAMGFPVCSQEKRKQNASNGGKSGCPQKGFRALQKNVSHIQV